jgi:hypothetical protein
LFTICQLFLIRTVLKNESLTGIVGEDSHIAGIDFNAGEANEFFVDYPSIGLLCPLW